MFASCSSDGSIRLWDARAAAADACVCTVANAHDSDVNVISWNTTEPFLLSGGDDGELKVWDLKLIQVGLLLFYDLFRVIDIYCVSVRPSGGTLQAPLEADHFGALESER